MTLAVSMKSTIHVVSQISVILLQTEFTLPSPSSIQLCEVTLKHLELN